MAETTHFYGILLKRYRFSQSSGVPRGRIVRCLSVVNIRDRKGVSSLTIGMNRGASPIKYFNLVGTT